MDDWRPRRKNMKLFVSRLNPVIQVAKIVMIFVFPLMGLVLKRGV
jgi:hypothetical protein